MPGATDACIKDLYITEPNGNDPAEVVGKGKPFDIVADIEIGGQVMRHIDADKLFASVRNVHRSSATPLPVLTTNRAAARGSSSFRDTLRIKVGPGWTASEGDLLEAVATYKTESGLDLDYSKATSQQVMVTA